MDNRKPFPTGAESAEGPQPPLAPEGSHVEIVEEVSPADPGADIVALLKKAEDEAAAMKDAYLRARADLENVRRQGQAEVAKAHKYAIERFAEALLPVKDALESALSAPAGDPQTLREGVELTLKQLVAAFDKAQLTQLDPVGEKFDPHLHQAITMVESHQPANTVVQVMQKGYRLQDRVLRPAMVVVAKGRADAAT